jgi:hypothetical protein
MRERPVTLNPNFPQQADFKFRVTYIGPSADAHPDRTPMPRTRPAELDPWGQPIRHRPTEAEIAGWGP